MSDDSTRFEIYRNWLISVLYLNTMVYQYFCACLGQIASTYQVGKYNPLGYLAVNNYARHYHPECWGASGDTQYAQDSLYDAQHGSDPSHLPSLDSMGLGFLLHNSGIPSPSTPVSWTSLTDVTIMPNPSQGLIIVSYTLAHQSYIQLELLDALGKTIWSRPGASEMQGQHN